MIVLSAIVTVHPDNGSLRLGEGSRLVGSEEGIAREGVRVWIVLMSSNDHGRGREGEERRCASLEDSD